ncbi:MAG: HAD family hydrolase [Myxococcota bacterium]
MNPLRRSLPLAILAILALSVVGCGGSRPATPADPTAAPAAPPDPLPSWSDTATKQRIIAFVESVTDPNQVTYVKPEARIATFDNDGTLWVEQPLYTELVFAIDRVRNLASMHPEWKRKEPYRSLLKGDMEGVASMGRRAVVDLVLTSHTGMSAELFDTIVLDWLQSAKHARWDQLYTNLTYRPQIELLEYLRANGFTTYIVSGGTVEFMRPWTGEAYGIPKQQVIGSSVATRFEIQGGKPSLLRLPQVEFVDDKSGKPVGIHQFIGRQPILAFGNSDGDLEMLQYTTMGSGGTRLGLLLHHDDAVREYAYDRDSVVGRLDVALDEAPDAGWVVVSMKDDWNRVFSFDEEEASDATAGAESAGEEE